jgi:phosphate transport system substrate-binding protein
MEVTDEKARVARAHDGGGRHHVRPVQIAWLDTVTDDAEKILPGVDPSKVEGAIVSAGSSTVFPLSEAVAEQFKKEGYKGQITIDSIGSGAGFERLGKAEIDVSNASSRIKSAQQEAAEKAFGSKVIEFRVGTDAIAVCVSSKNTFLKDASMEDLAKIFSTAKLWSDVNPAWPKKEIKRYTPGTDSGTFEYFVEHVFKKDKKPLLSAANLQMSEDDNVLVQGIMGSEYAIGFFGFAYYLENAKKLKAVSLAGVAPNQASVDAGTYALARPLFMYAAEKTLREKPQVAAYLCYYLSNVNGLIKKVGYFPAPAAAMTASKKALADAIKGLY